MIDRFLAEVRFCVAAAAAAGLPYRRPWTGRSADGMIGPLLAEVRVGVGFRAAAAGLPYRRA
ncbi:hypothetical protein [Amnibacterium sp.]|uniref:hypothetical protein n=1 Tax=Amnibacterium sp. TaxID=1872496 RepID=UPI003F7C9477